MIDLRSFLNRIGVEPDHLEQGDEVLRFLQRKHLLSIPFENLDIHWNRPIVLQVEKFYEKIVNEKRGGFCYELNGLFSEVLRLLGFETRLVSARVFNGTGYGPEYDHVAIIVTVEGDEFLADVGFGDFATEPLRYSLGAEQHDPSGVYAIRRSDDDYIEVAKRNGCNWRSEYIFKDIPRKLEEFSEMCNFQQYSSASHFKKGKICSILTETGRKTLTDHKFIVTSDGERTEREIVSSAGFDEILQREFNIVDLRAA